MPLFFGLGILQSRGDMHPLWGALVLPLFDDKVKGQVNVMMVRDIPSLQRHTPIYQISLTYLQRQKSYGPDNLR